MIEDTIEEDNLRKAFFSYDPENDPNGSIGRGLADAVYESCGRNVDNIPGWIHGQENHSLLSEENKYLQLYKATDKSHVSPYNVYTDSGVKSKLIKEIIGYTKLRTGKGVSTKIENCAPEVVGEVFKRLYQKSLKEYKKAHSCR